MNELEKVWKEKIEYATALLSRGVTKGQLQKDEKFLNYLKIENELAQQRNANLK